MEFLEGTTLKHQITGRPLDSELLLDVSIQIADEAQGEGSAALRRPLGTARGWENAPD
jgi:hypothetical protein